MTRVVDVSNSVSFEDVAVMKFFEASTRNLLAQEAAAGVRHHVALSVVGTERLSESGQLLPGENCSGETDQRIFNPILHRPRDICIAFVPGGGWHASVPRAAHKLLEECGYMGWWIDIHRWFINSAVVIAKALECARGRELAVTVWDSNQRRGSVLTN
jgi:hypothetical protein